MADVFISYPQRERDLMLPLKEKLQRLDLDLFVDIDGRLDSSPNFPDALDAGVRDAKAVLACWSPWALTREWVKNECAIARDLNKLVAVELAPLSVSDVPAEFYRVERKSLVGFDGDDAHPGWGAVLSALAIKFRIWASMHGADPDVERVLEKAARLDRMALAARPSPPNGAGEVRMGPVRERGRTSRPASIRWTITSSRSISQRRQRCCSRRATAANWNPGRGSTSSMSMRSMRFCEALPSLRLKHRRGRTAQPLKQRTLSRRPRAMRANGQRVRRWRSV
ncbi:hypothetical protein U91I_01747 [alpha proteobacterium U9-1i]|nr:hypothetical protein U91I_01747 [alpha proteobacterium U9-1i]